MANKTIFVKIVTIEMDWADQIRATFGKPVRPKILEFLQSKGFNKR